MSDEPKRLLETALRAARAGGEIALARLAEQGERRPKGPRDMVPSAALEVQSRIQSVIAQEYPDARFLTEESESESPHDAEPLWIVDPIDGSVNYFQGIPIFSIALAYRAEADYQLGIVFDPSRNEMFHAISGGGAYMNGARIVVDQFSDGVEAFQAAIVGTDWSGDEDEVKRSLQMTRFLAPQVMHIRVLGSPSLGLSYVAKGRFHAYFGLEHLKLWDVAPASVILKEAGGTLTDIRGASWLYAEEGYLASNSIIHGSMYRALLPILELQQSRRESMPVG